MVGGWVEGCFQDLDFFFWWCFNGFCNHGIHHHQIIMWGNMCFTFSNYLDLEMLGGCYIQDFWMPKKLVFTKPPSSEGSFPKIWTFMSQILDAFSTHFKRLRGLLGLSARKDLNQLESPSCTCPLGQGFFRGPPGPTIFHMIRVGCCFTPQKKLDKKNAAARQMCLNRFKTGKACQTQWSLLPAQVVAHPQRSCYGA